MTKDFENEKDGRRASAGLGSHAIKKGDQNDREERYRLQDPRRHILVG